MVSLYFHWGLQANEFVYGDFICKYLLFFNSHMVSLYFHRCLQANDFVYGDFLHYQL